MTLFQTIYISFVVGLTGGSLGYWLAWHVDTWRLEWLQRRHFKASCKRYGISTAKLYSIRDYNKEGWME